MARKIVAQRGELAQADRAEEYRIAGDLLTANLHRVEPGTSLVELPNFYDSDKLLALTLDPSLSPSANAQEYYRKYQKAKKTLAKAQEQLEASLDEQRYLEGVKTALELSDSVREVREIRSELVRGGYLPKDPGADRGEREALGEEDPPRVRRRSLSSRPTGLRSSSAATTGKTTS